LELVTAVATVIPCKRNQYALIPIISVKESEPYELVAFDLNVSRPFRGVFPFSPSL
jgi:hypothetical protein